VFAPLTDNGAHGHEPALRAGAGRDEITRIAIWHVSAAAVLAYVNCQSWFDVKV
jgi:hypothetical protein